MKELFKQWLNIYKQKKRRKNTFLKDVSLDDHFRSMKQNEAVNNMRWIKYRKDHPAPILNHFKLQQELKQSYLAIAHGVSIKLFGHEGKSFISFYKDCELLHSFLFFNEDYPIVKRRCDGFIGYDTHALCQMLDYATKKL